MEPPAKSFRELESWIQELQQKESLLKREAAARDVLLKKLKGELDQQKKLTEGTKREMKGQLERQRVQTDKDLRHAREATRKAVRDHSNVQSQLQRVQRDQEQLNEERDELIEELDEQKEEVTRLGTLSDNQVKALAERDLQIRNLNQSISKLKAQMKSSKKAQDEMESWAKNLVSNVDTGSFRKAGSNSTGRRSSKKAKRKKSGRKGR